MEEDIDAIRPCRFTYPSKSGPLMGLIVEFGEDLTLWAVSLDTSGEQSTVQQGNDPPELITVGEASYELYGWSGREHEVVLLHSEKVLVTDLDDEDQDISMLMRPLFRCPELFPVHVDLFRKEGDDAVRWAGDEEVVAFRRHDDGVYLINTAATYGGLFKE